MPNCEQSTQSFLTVIFQQIMFCSKTSPFLYTEPNKYWIHNYVMCIALRPFKCIDTFLPLKTICICLIHGKMFFYTKATWTTLITFIYAQVLLLYRKVQHHKCRSVLSWINNFLFNVKNSNSFLLVISTKQLYHLT